MPEAQIPPTLHGVFEEIKSKGPMAACEIVDGNHTIKTLHRKTKELEALGLIETAGKDGRTMLWKAKATNR